VAHLVQASDAEELLIVIVFAVVDFVIFALSLQVPVLFQRVCVNRRERGAGCAALSGE
jgi:hypothetical protein